MIFWKLFSGRAWPAPSEREGQTQRGKNGQLAGHVAGYEVDVEHVVAVVDVGHTKVGFEQGAFREIELALHINVETVVGGQATAIQFAIQHTQIAVGVSVVEIDAILKGIILIEALHLREGEAAAEVPASAELPLTLGARRVGQNHVDVVAAVEVRRVLCQLHTVLNGLLVFSRHEAQSIHGPQVPMLVLVFQ